MSHHDAFFPVTYSVPSAKALLERVQGDYAGMLDGTAKECRFLSRGLNDVFELVTDAGVRYVLRVYRQGHRTLADILYELEVLRHLQTKGAAVSAPIMRADGEWLGMLTLPEGTRQTVLFTYAPGHEPRYEGDREEAEVMLYAREAATIHTASDDFQCEHARYALDLEHLLWQPLRLIKPFFSERINDWLSIESLASKLKQRFDGLDMSKFSTGFCHGDFHGGNAHIHYQQSNLVEGAAETDDATGLVQAVESPSLIFFDFDCCGFGLRAYDIAVFRWNARHRDKDKSRWPLFLKGYQQVRELSAEEIQATDLLVPIRQFWLMGTHVNLSPDFSVGWLNDAYFDRHLDFLRKWDAEFLSSDAN